MRSTILLLLPFTALACGAPQTPGANPHDMSSAQHLSMASQEEAEAAAHGSRFDPSQSTTHRACSGVSGGASRGSGVISTRKCWTSVTNPTAQHLEHEAQHARAAADHRAASQALRDAEARACVGIAEEDRDMSPFAHREDLARVEALIRDQRLEGATIVFRPIPGLTVDGLQRVVDCHLARNAALGHDVPEMPYCPLVPNNVSARVSPTHGGFAVAIRSDDPVVAAEILHRAQRLR